MRGHHARVSTPNFLESTFSSRADRIVALLLVLLMFAATLALLPMAQKTLEPSPNFQIIILTVRVLATLLTAYILTLNWRMMQQAPHALLANGYFFAGMCTMAQMVITLDPTMLGNRSLPTHDSIMWLGVAWHTVFAIYAVIATAMQRQWLNFRPLTVNLIGWSTIGLFAWAIAMISVFDDVLPPFIHDGESTSVNIVLHILLYLTLLSCAFVVLTTRLRHQQDLWLSMVLFAFGLEIMVSVHSVDMFSIGWYTSRLLGVVGSSIMLIVFIRGVTATSRNLRDNNQQLNQLALSDALTGLSNRRHFDDQLMQLCRYALRDKIPCTLLVIDVDYFKQYNDHFGHPAGDACLKQIAGALRAAAWRPLDMIARIGGEEFAVLLPGADEDGAAVLAARILHAIRRLNIQHPTVNTKIVTASIGGATLTAGDPDLMPDALLHAADRALYEAKNNGRNHARFDREFNDRATAPQQAAQS